MNGENNSKEWAELKDKLRETKRQLEQCPSCAKLQTENEKLNAMRTHCTRCGGDYLATGVEVSCSCKLQTENTAMKVVIEAAKNYIKADRYGCGLFWELEALKGALRAYDEAVKG